MVYYIRWIRTGEALAHLYLIRMIINSPLFEAKCEHVCAYCVAMSMTMGLPPSDVIDDPDDVDDDDVRYIFRAFSDATTARARRNINHSMKTSCAAPSNGNINIQHRCTHIQCISHVCSMYSIYILSGA